ncbi:MAG: site-specific integrase [Planctomycetes bacterium]|nr:site-specific integrase [Planctomycetota bacterium]
MGDLDVERCLLTRRGETTKNGKTRVLPLRRDYVNELVALRPIHERVLWRDVLPTDRLFLTPEGSPWDPISNNALRIFRRLLECAEIDRTDTRGHVIDLHALRHTCATRLARSGVPITTTQKLLGHSTVELTARYYTHVEVEDLRDAIESVAAAAKKSHLKAVRAEVG